ncbi:MAG: hypothetical protein WA862_10995 [Solirubrobacterales bacterium]
MADDFSIPRPSAFLGNFGGFIEVVRKDLEEQYGDDAGQFESVAQRAEAQAPIVAAQGWLIERWGDHFPCPVCENVEWTVSEVGPAFRPTGYLSFHVTCGYCGNTMQVVPGIVSLEAPRREDKQLHFPEPEK